MKQMQAIRTVSIRTGLFIALLMMFLLHSQGTAQRQNIEGKSFEKHNGRWYKFEKGERRFEIEPQRVVVRMRDRGNPRRLDFTGMGFSRLKVVSQEILGGYYVLDLGSEFDPFGAMASIARNPNFDYVDFDGYAEYHDAPGDQYYGTQWNLPKISMPNTWTLTKGNKKIILAIIDSGVDYLHPDLDGSLWHNLTEENGTAGVDDDNNGYLDDFYGWDFKEYDNSPMDTYGHGTLAAGVALAQTNNLEGGSYVGIAGVAGPWSGAPGVKMMVLRVSDVGPASFISSATEAVTYAVKNGATVISMSFGWLPGEYYDADVFNTAANQYNCVLVASAGNNGGTSSAQDHSVRAPALLPTVIAVGATIQDDSRWVHDITLGSAFGPELDIMAPGGEPIIYSTDIRGAGGISAGDYAYFSGTSASAPHVAAAAALVRSVNPLLSSQAVRDILTGAADKVAGMGGNPFTNYYGYGRLNVQAAVNAAAAATVTSNFTSGWNMASVPIAVPNYSTSVVFPNATQVQQYSQGTYTPIATAANGVGYWMQFPSTPAPVTYTGVRTTPQIAPVTADWNIIGSCGWNLPTSKVTASSGVSVLTSFFEYNNGYFPVDIIQPGKGYWVKVNQAGSLELDITPNYPSGVNPPLPQPPTLVSPANNQGGVSLTPTLTWSGSVGAQGYRIQVDLQPDMVFPMIDVVTAQTSYAIVGPLQDGVSYYWHVAAINANGTGAYSPSRKFTCNIQGQDPPPPCGSGGSYQSMDQFQFLDQSSTRQVLYTLNNAQSSQLGFSNFELPPSIPGRFDARFSGQKFIQQVESNGQMQEFRVMLRNIHAPAQLKWAIKRGNGIQYWVRDESRPNLRRPLSATGSMYFDAGSDSVLVLYASALPPCEGQKAIPSLPDAEEMSDPVVPAEFALRQSYPNPFNPTAVIGYDLPSEEFVRLAVFNTLGQEVALLVNEQQAAGYQTVVFNADNLPAGMYIYRLQAGSYVNVKKMLLIK